MDHEETHVSKIVRNIDDLLNLCKKRPKTAAFIIIVFLVCSCFWVSLQWYKINKLTEDNNDLKDKNSKLEAQLAPFRAAAAIWYPGNVEEGLRKLADKINKLESDQRDLVRFGNIAKYNFFGDIPMGGMATNGPLTGWCKGYVEKIKGGLSFKCDEKSITHYLEVINKNPDFPYPYFLVAKCFLKQNDQKWKKYAEECVALIEKIVKVPGHFPGYDEFLNITKDMISKNSLTN